MKIALTLAATLMLCGASFAQSQSDSSVPTIPATQIEPRKVATGYEFVSAASSADDFEIRSSKLALQLAASDDVKKMAQMLIDDHTKAQAEVIEAGKQENVVITIPGVDGEQQGLLGKLEAVKGADFDKMYLEAQVFVHQRAIALFKGYAGRDTPLSKYAEKTLPVLEKHYTMAVDLSAKLGAGKVVQ